MNEQVYHRLVLDMIPNYLKPQVDQATYALGHLYNSSDPDPFSFDFENDIILRYAYFYRYFVCISNAVRVCWTKLADIRFPGFLENKPELNVCCIGGGPGSDLVGLCRFMEYNDIDVQVNAVILDYNNWSRETRKLFANINDSYGYGIIHFDYVRYNFFQSPIRDKIIYCIRNADVITIVKFLSAVGANCYNFQLLQELLSHMKRNARLFFMDNSGGPFKSMMDQVAESIGLKLVCQVIHRKIKVSPGESEMMNFSRFQTFPQKSTSVSASLWRKTDYY